MSNSMEYTSNKGGEEHTNQQAIKVQLVPVQDCIT